MSRRVVILGTVVFALFLVSDLTAAGAQFPLSRSNPVILSATADAATDTLTIVGRNFIRSRRQLHVTLNG